MRQPIRLVLCVAVVCAPAFAHAADTPLRAFLSVALSPDGRHVASIEGDEPAGGGYPDIQSLVIRDADGRHAATVALPCGAVPQCTPSDAAWTPDGTHVAFALRTPGSHAHSLYLADAAGGPPARLLDFDGTLGGLRYAPDGTLAVLATEGAAKETGAVEAGAAQTGEIGADIHEQRIAVLHDGALRYASPPDLFVYEYDFRPDGAGFVGTAAPGDGDDHWWVAKLYAFENGAGRVVYAPSDPRQQIAQPRVSADGTRVSFIGGIMSDFGSTGGDAYVLDLGKDEAPVNVTQDWKASVTSLGWACDGASLRAALLHGDVTEVAELASEPKDTPARTLAVTRQTLRASEGEAVSAACGADRFATIREDFGTAPEIAVGPIAAMRDATHDNAGWTSPAKAQSLTWRHDGYTVQGFLLRPAGAADDAKLAMVVWVHGGPAAAHRQRFVGPGLYRDLLSHGYALLLPNPRGSFGQGEAFAAANVRDLGYGDLGDILAGVDAAEAASAVDDAKLGLAGWSYGGFMTMFGVTQTDRFHAAFAGAGVSNWQSYYGQNGIDSWMIPYFGRSVYDDPAIYARSSALTYIKQVRTPTFSVVGERDVECPAPQTLEFWHALNTLGVPTGAVVYPGEGHGFRDPKNVADLGRRMVAWFDAHLKR